MPLKIEANSNGTVTTLFPNAKDQRHDLGWNTKADLVWSSRQIPETGYPVLLIALFPDVIERPRHTKKPAGLADIAADSLRMLPGSARKLDSSALLLTFATALLGATHGPLLTVDRRSRPVHAELYRVLWARPLRGSTGSQRRVWFFPYDSSLACTDWPRFGSNFLFPSFPLGTASG